MDYVDLNRIKAVIDLYEKIKEIDKSEHFFFNDRLLFLKKNVDDFQFNNVVVNDATKTEISIVYKSLLLRIEKKYIPDSLKVKSVYGKPPTKIQQIIRNKIKCHVIKKNLLDAKILLKRKFKYVHSYDKFGLELNENILLQMEMNFISENPDILEL